MKPTGKTVNGLPEMVPLSDTTATYQTVFEHIDNTVVREFIDCYFLAQIYLWQKKKLDRIEPAYIALTGNQGGFAKKGFAFAKGEKTLKKPQVHYVDITEGQATASPDKLMSFTQLYPHELGHVFYHLLSPEDSLENNTKNVDMHFFSVVTDYSTAFNEGFAEHIENVSRRLEKNTDVKKGISADIRQIEASIAPSIRGFKRDFLYPFRLGYYKASMLFWYQKYEDFKRYEQAVNGDIRYKSEVLSLRNVEDQLTYRNSGVALNKEERRNYIQLLATEGAVSAFFTRLSGSKLANRYLLPAFYQQFLYDPDTPMQDPKMFFSPMENQFLKYFHVLHNHVVFNNASGAQLTDFINGYLKEFPSEGDAVKDLFYEALGSEYSDEVPPPLWILVKNHNHRLLVFDPFDAIMVPMYTFDLNAAEVEDLLTIEGLDRREAEKIIRYRETEGFFTDWEQVRLLPDLATGTAERITSSAFDETYFEETLEDFNPVLSISTLIAAPLKYILLRGIAYFILMYIVISYLVVRQTSTLKQGLVLFLNYLLLWILFVLGGLLIVLLNTQNAYLFLLGFAVLLASLVLLLYRKHPLKKRRTLAFLTAMTLSILISML